MKNTISKIRLLAPSYGSLPFWSWNDRLDPEELRRQIRQMKSLGMNGFFMHARGGLETEYLSDEWFECISACVDEAKKHGMEAWSYDENGWPSGFAGGALLNDKKNFALSIEYRMGKFPPQPQNDDDDEIIAVYTKNPDGSFTQVTNDNGSDEYLILYRRYDNSYVDTLNGEVTEKFIEATHAEYKKRLSDEDFGSAMPGFFTDEPQYYRWGHPYSNILPHEFEEVYGYSIFKNLPALFFDFDGADKFRYDYYYLIHKLFINNFIKKIYDRCTELGCAVTGHAVEESSLAGQMMCIGGCMPFYEYETMPGIDYLGRGIQDDIAMKQLGSACAQLGKKKALSEMFGCCGWDVSPNELKRIAEVQYAGGVNIMCQHLYPYSERGQRKRDYPLHYSEHNPWFSDMAEFDNYFNSLGAALSVGPEYAPILVIHPIHGAYCKYKKDDSSSLSEIEGKFFELSRFLGYNQIPYHYGDEWMMQRMASVEMLNGTAHVKVGKCAYSTVIVPFTYSLDSSTVSLLKEFISAGGKVYVYDRKPDYIDGLPADYEWLNSNINIENLLSLKDTTILQNGKNLPELRKMSRITDDGEWIVYITNVSDKTLENVNVTLPYTTQKWARLDLNTLTTKPIYIKNNTAVLNFSDAESYLLVSGDDIDCQPLSEIPSIQKEYIPVPKTVRLIGKPANILTLDTCERSNDGINYDAPLSIYGVKDNLLSERYAGKVYLKFSFTLDYTPETLKICVEPMYQRIWINNSEIFPNKNDSWFDRSFACAEISSLTHAGQNDIVIEVKHFQRDHVYHVLYDGVSESLRNCLVFDTEIEPIYLLGDFGVRCDGVFEDSERNSTIFDGKFTLVSQPNTLPSDNIVRGGFPFFSGRITTEFDYDYCSGKPSVLHLDGRFATAEISVNGKAVAKMLFNRTVELAEYLCDGSNTITVTLCNSMRNTLGPHHRHDPEPYGVGPGTFSFEKEWHGRICNGYAERYSFVKYSLSN